jgi:hypothetical protein
MTGVNLLRSWLRVLRPEASMLGAPRLAIPETACARRGAPMLTTPRDTASRITASRRSTARSAAAALAAPLLVTLAVVTLVALLQVPACASAHYSLESAFENPASLTRVGRDRMLHASATLTGRSQLLTYVEYDPGAEGYGALAVRVGDLAPGWFAAGSASGSASGGASGGSSGGAGVTTWSYVGARKLGPVAFGFAINQATGASPACTFDTGLTFDFRALTVSLACRQLELGGSGLTARGSIISGLELRISDCLSLCLDAANSIDPEYRLSVAAEGQLVSTRFYVMGRKHAPLNSGVEVGLKFSDLTVRLGYHLDRVGDRQIAGVGIVYAFD